MNNPNQPTPAAVTVTAEDMATARTQLRRLWGWNPVAPARTTHDIKKIAELLAQSRAAAEERARADRERVEQAARYALDRLEACTPYLSNDSILLREGAIASNRLAIKQLRAALTPPPTDEAKGEKS